MATIRVVATGDRERWVTDGKFFRAGGRRVWMQAVTYGPFPPGEPVSREGDFRRIAAAGFNAVRLFEMPDHRLLDAAGRCGLSVFGGLKWGQNADFIARPGLLGAARVGLVEALRETRGHPALAGVYVANEVPADLVRWIGPVRVRQVLEDLIEVGRGLAPELLFAYANYPTTEYLEPDNSDFTAFNIYLEDPAAFRSYVKRLHHAAGDRPLVISEFGLDSRRNGPDRQAEVLSWARRITAEEEAAGFTAFAWSDRWFNGGEEVEDWDFGLTDRDGLEKPALVELSRPLRSEAVSAPGFSVIVCTRNGRGRIGRCLEAVRALRGIEMETIVVDDGSGDGTGDYVAAVFPWVRLLRLTPCGLSAARNAGAAAAHGEVLAFTDDDCEPDMEWLIRASRILQCGRYAAVGGPNLPPRPGSWQEAVICAVPGAPSHVMLDDEEAEHLPGCNLLVTKHAFDAIGGFDDAFRTAGDDVDFCWRLSDAGFRLGFAPGAFVWHRRRSTMAAYLRQQAGYGVAERMLSVKHPDRFCRRGGAKWRGFVYGGGPVRVVEGSIIYHGVMGEAGYQCVVNRTLPCRSLDSRFDGWRARLALWAMERLGSWVRSWARNRRLRLHVAQRSRDTKPVETHELAIAGVRRESVFQLLKEAGWVAAGPTDEWDARCGNARILLAEERGDHGFRRLLVRFSGDEMMFSEIRGLLNENGLSG